MERPYIQNPFPPPPRQTGRAVLFFSMALVALAGCGYLVWMLVMPESSPTISAPEPAAAAQSEIATLAAQLGMFQKNVGRYPTVAEGLEALKERPANVPKEIPWMKLRREIPRDPWGRAYEYEEMPGDPPVFRVFSRGENPNDPADDISQTLPAVPASATRAADATPAGSPKFR